MITLSPECYPCFFRQADLAARAHGASETERKALAARVAAILADRSEEEIPAKIASRLHETVRRELGVDDPFQGVKEREFRRFAEVASKAESLVAASADPMAAAVWLAAFGKNMDSGSIERGAVGGGLGGGPRRRKDPGSSRTGSGRRSLAPGRSGFCWTMRGKRPSTSRSSPASRKRGGRCGSA